MLRNNSSFIGKNEFGRLIPAIGLLVCLCGLFSCGSKKIIHNTIYHDEPAIVALKQKYASILHVEKNQIKNIALYQSIDKWTIVRDSNMAKLGSLNVSFIQYLYYLNLRTKLPADFKELYEARKTYLFKDCHFLEEGDLVFFKENYRAVKEVGFYLDNDVFVAADAGGDLRFHHLRDSINRFHVISNAKILKDVE
ncbi:NlpC/P60 family protein [Labilibaculum manganireducens]|uniref:NlpC/P60 family protein n=1 Tax=Labilibaculum manganireducens TaxID=1940525 RepID=UPI0029F4DB7F|nr:NlpC/P60 family protein [Labilibaculum manganireducens]